MAPKLNLGLNGMDDIINIIANIIIKKITKHNDR
jgi:hypothetical protein